MSPQNEKPWSYLEMITQLHLPPNPHSPFVPKEHKQKEIIFHGLNLVTQDLISTKATIQKVSWTLVESGRYLGAGHPEPQPVLGIPELCEYKQPGYREIEPSIAI